MSKFLRGKNMGKSGESGQVWKVSGQVTKGEVFRVTPDSCQRDTLTGTLKILRYPDTTGDDQRHYRHKKTRCYAGF